MANSKNQTKRDISKEYEQMGRQLEALYDSVNPKKGALYKAAFIKGVLAGVGGVIGATVVIALLLWVLTFFENVPLIGDFFEALNNTIEKKE